MPAQHTQSTGLLCGWPVALELSTRQLERSESWHFRRQLKTRIGDVSGRYALRIDLLTYLLTYLVTGCLVSGYAHEFFYFPLSSCTRHPVQTVSRTSTGSSAIRCSTTAVLVLSCN